MNLRERGIHATAMNMPRRTYDQFAGEGAICKFESAVFMSHI